MLLWQEMRDCLVAACDAGVAHLQRPEIIGVLVDELLDVGVRRELSFADLEAARVELARVGGVALLAAAAALIHELVALGHELGQLVALAANCIWELLRKEGLGPLDLMDL